VTELVYDPRKDLLIVTVGTERVVMIDNHGEVMFLKLF
jgi:hypothetical protein